MFVETNGIRLHYLDFEGNEPTLILTHGLTANAHAFDGMIRAGLSPQFRIISVDLRGRGLSDKPASGYKMEDHAKDIIGLLDSLNIQKAIMGGHSFGALLTFYLASHYPDRIEKMVLMDAAAQMHPNTKEMLGNTLSRLGYRFDSFEAYLNKMRQAPYLDFWDEAMLSYYEADVEKFSDGSVMPRSKAENIIEAMTEVLSEPWLDYMQNVTQPAILLNATGTYNLGAPLLPKENALATVQLMRNCRYVEVKSGNHQTMLYGTGAKEMVDSIVGFLSV